MAKRNRPPLQLERLEWRELLPTITSVVEYPHADRIFQSRGNSLVKDKKRRD
jgi:hypothetical protein